MNRPVDSQNLPILAKARALQALIHPDSGAAEGERRNAVAALERLMARHHFTLADLDAGCRKKCTRDTATRDEATLCGYLASYVTGDWAMSSWIGEMRLNGKKRKYRAIVHLTDAEAEDWRAACDHYVPLFREQRRALLAQRRAIDRAIKEAVTGFASKFSLHGQRDSDTPGRPLTPAEWQAIITAARAASGAPWLRPAARLNGPSASLS